MKKQKRNRGRQAQHYIAADGTQIKGLAQRPSDGRWRIIGTNITFTEDDPQKAIDRFRRLTQKDEPIIGSVGVAGVKVKVTPSQLKSLAEKMDVSEDDLLDLLTGDDARFWERVKREIQQRPQFAAQKTGIEQLGYLTDLKPPDPIPTFEQIEETWKTHFKKSKEQRRKVLAAWKDFIKTAGVVGLRDICDDVVTAYKRKVYARNLKAKTQKNMFTRIQRLISFNIEQKRNKYLSECLDCLMRLKCDDEAPDSPDPVAITRDEFFKLRIAAQNSAKPAENTVRSAALRD